MGAMLLEPRSKESPEILERPISYLIRRLSSLEEAVLDCARSQSLLIYD